MKIGFISANQEKLPDPVIPLGILTVMGNVPKHHEIKLWDLCFEKDPLTFLKTEVENFKPDLIAIGVRNIQNNDYSDYKFNVKTYQKLFGFLQELTDVPLVAGGSGFSVMPKELMELWRPDFGISGEGESSLPQLLEILEAGGEEYHEVSNLFYWQNGELKESTGFKGFLNIDDCQPADRKFADSRYFDFTGINNVQTKRGCPLKCTYCTYPKIEGRIKRVRDPKLVVDEMFATLETHPRTNHFFVVDSVFNHPRDHAKEFCRELIRRDWKVPWTCYVNPLSFDESLAEVMVQAKCAGYEVGSDSGCDDILKALKKGFLTKDIIRMKAISKKFGLKDCHTFVLGTPWETMEHVFQSIAFIEALEPTAAVLMAWNDDAESVDHVLASERKVFRQQIIELFKIKKQQNPTWVIPPLSYNFDERLFKVLRKRNLSGPLWQQL